MAEGSFCYSFQACQRAILAAFAFPSPIYIHKKRAAPAAALFLESMVPGCRRAYAARHFFTFFIRPRPLAKRFCLLLFQKSNSAAGRLSLRFALQFDLCVIGILNIGIVQRLPHLRTEFGQILLAQLLPFLLFLRGQCPFLGQRRQLIDAF